MSGHAPAQAVALSVITKQADGSAVLRRWNLCEHCAAALTAPLGAPDTEVLMPPDAIDRIIARGPEPDGVVITREPT